MQINEIRTVTGVATLADLRTLVESVSDWSDDTKVTLKGGERYSAIDYDEPSVTLIR